MRHGQGLAPHTSLLLRPESQVQKSSMCAIVCRWALSRGEARNALPAQQNRASSSAHLGVVVGAQVHVQLAGVLRVLVRVDVVEEEKGVRHKRALLRDRQRGHAQRSG